MMGLMMLLLLCNAGWYAVELVHERQWKDLVVLGGITLVALSAGVMAALGIVPDLYMLVRKWVGIR